MRARSDLLNKRERRQLLAHLDRRVMLVYAALAGLAAGAVATVFHVLVDAISARGPGWALAVWNRGVLFGAALVVGGAAIGAIASWVTRFVPEARGSGIPRVKLVLSGIRVLRPAKVLAVKLGAGLAALTAGMSLGREGPTIHMGAAAAALFARLAKLPARAMSPLVAAGGGAGLAAAFNAPLAGFLFVMEELRREFSPASYGTALVASLGAVAVTRLAVGESLSLSVPAMTTYELGLVPIAIGIGVGGLILGQCFNAALIGALVFRDRAKIPPWSIGALAGALGVVAMIFIPLVAFGGHPLVEASLSGALGTSALAVALLLAAKFAFTVLCYASAVPGGIFLPLLSLGGLWGLIVALVLGQVAPAYSISPAILGTLGMASVLTGSVRAPLTSAVLIVEMTGEYHLVYVLLVAAFSTHALGEFFGFRGIYDRLVDRDLRRHPAGRDEEGGIIEALVEETSALRGQRVRRLSWPEGVFIATVNRDGNPLPPNDSLRLEAGDVLTIVVAPGADRRSLAEILAGSMDSGPHLPSGRPSLPPSSPFN